MKRFFIKDKYKKVNEYVRDNFVFYFSLFILCIILGAFILYKSRFALVLDITIKLISEKLGIVYLISMPLFILFAFIIALSKFGNIKLGEEDSKPQYTTGTWFAMLFGAGMGIGLVFWGIAEPIAHFTSPLGNMTEGSLKAARLAFITSFMHWGVHPWASYSIVGLALAYFQFRKGAPSLISSIFIPLLGEKSTKGLRGNIVDILAVFATVAGVSTSLGMGTMQINSGLHYMFNVPQSIKVQLIIIVIVTSIFICTAVSGLNKGISIMSNINLILIVGIMTFCFFIGPTGEILKSLVWGTVSYLKSFIGTSVQIEGFKHKLWLKNWTIFYWAWWISWTPFVGMFIARISKGRTIRQFILGVIVAPTLASIIWFSIFGTLGIHLGLNNIVPIDTLKAIASTPETAFFRIIGYYPFHYIISIMTMMLLCTFFITSADSATFVLAMLTSKGDLNPSNKKKVLWGVIEAIIAIILLISGGLSALQTIAIIVAFPFTIIIILGFISLCKALREEK